MTRVTGRAKLNFDLRVGAPLPEGLHPIRSLVTTIDWHDTLTIQLGAATELLVSGTAAEGVPDDASNLVLAGLELFRSRSGLSPTCRIVLEKSIPHAAGLGGGSADAAAMLIALDEMHGTSLAPELAPLLGADVPFSLRGGSAVMSGFGEVVDPRPPWSGFWVAVVVPPIELATADVYRVWDQLGRPTGPEVGPSGLPDSLRPSAPLVNDLYPAAVRLAPELGDWRAELGSAWNVPVMMSGSGSALFGCFSDPSDAEEAAARFLASARAAVSAAPTPFGARSAAGYNDAAQ